MALVALKPADPASSQEQRSHLSPGFASTLSIKGREKRKIDQSFLLESAGGSYLLPLEWDIVSRAAANSPPTLEAHLLHWSRRPSSGRMKLFRTLDILVPVFHPEPCR